MLVLSRSPQEAVMLGDDIGVEVMDLTPTTVKLRAYRSSIGGRLTEEISSAELSRDGRFEIEAELQIQVVDIHPQLNKVRLGITAPKHVSVHRKEVYDAIRRKKPPNPPPDDLNT